MWALWITFILGVWFFVSGIIPGLIAEWNMIIFGLITMIFGFIGYFNDRKSWQAVLCGIIGIWFFLSGIWFGLIASWNFIIFGIILAILGIWGAQTKPAGGQTSPAA